MTNDISGQLYSYSWSTKFLFYIFSILLAFLNLLFGIQLILKTVTWLLGGPTNSSSIVGLIIALLIFGFCLALCSNAYPNVKVYDEGLKVQVFLFWWIFVSWTDIENIWDVGVFIKSYPVAVRKLTPFHRIIGLGYGSLKPVFSVSRTMEGYNELIKIIKQNIQTHSSWRR